MEGQINAGVKFISGDQDFFAAQITRDAIDVYAASLVNIIIYDLTIVDVIHREASAPVIFGGTVFNDAIDSPVNENSAVSDAVDSTIVNDDLGGVLNIDSRIAAIFNDTVFNHGIYTGSIDEVDPHFLESDNLKSIDDNIILVARIKTLGLRRDRYLAVEICDVFRPEIKCLVSIDHLRRKIKLAWRIDQVGMAVDRIPVTGQ